MRKSFSGVRYWVRASGIRKISIDNSVVNIFAISAIDFDNVERKLRLYYLSAVYPIARDWALGHPTNKVNLLFISTLCFAWTLDDVILCVENF